MIWTIGSIFLILLKPLLCEISEDDRDLSTDILEYVLRRGEGKNDSTIASDILGFVKNKIKDSEFEEIPPEIFKFVLEEESQTDINYRQQKIIFKKSHTINFADQLWWSNASRWELSQIWEFQINTYIYFSSF